MYQHQGLEEGCKHLIDLRGHVRKVLEIFCEISDFVLNLGDVLSSSLLIGTAQGTAFNKFSASAFDMTA